MVAKFLQKCSNSTTALDQLKRRIGKLSKSKQMPVQMSVTNVLDAKDADTNTDLYYEHFDYCEENVEYVIYDSTTEETDISNKSNEILETDGINSHGEDEQTAYNHTTDEVRLEISQNYKFSRLDFDTILISGYITTNKCNKENVEAIEESKKNIRDRIWVINKISY